MEVIEKAIKEGRKILSEYEAKLLLNQYSIPTAREVFVRDRNELKDAGQTIGFPMVMKGCSPEITHKTEQGLIITDIRNENEASEAFDEIYEKIKHLKDAGVLVQEMVKGKRELMVGMIRDPQFGPSVMFGLGGIFTEILRDVSFRVAPLDVKEAMDMMMEIGAKKILDPVRGMPAVDIEKLAELIVNVGKIGLENEHIKEMDINPLIISGSTPIAVDALIVLDSA